jgi:hypothetical protein
MEAVMWQDRAASLFVNISREDDARLHQVAARRDTCPSELVAVLIHHALEHGLPPEVERELDDARDRRRRRLGAP